MSDAIDGAPRSEARNAIEVKIEYRRLNAFFADYARNISRGRTFVRTGRPLPLGTEFVFSLCIPERGEVLRMRGEVETLASERDVADGRHPDPGMGIRFTYRDGATRDEVQRLVEDLMANSLGPRLSHRLMRQAKEL